MTVAEVSAATCYISQEFADYLDTHGLGAYAGRALSPHDARHDRTLPPVDEV